MTEKYYVIGAGGLAQEIFSWISTTPGWHLPEAFAVSDDKLDPDFVWQGMHQVGLSDLKAGDAFVMAIGAPKVKKALFEQLLQQGCLPLTFIHPSVLIGANSHIGEGSVLCPHVTLSCNVTLAMGVHLNVRTSLGHDCTVGEFTTLLGGNLINGDVHIGAECLIGSGAIVHPGLRIGDRSLLGIGSVLLRKMKSDERFLGNPARRLEG